MVLKGRIFCCDLLPVSLMVSYAQIYWRCVHLVATGQKERVVLIEQCGIVIEEERCI